jgi:hypothetical protein
MTTDPRRVREVRRSVVLGGTLPVRGEGHGGDRDAVTADSIERPLRAVGPEQDIAGTYVVRSKTVVRATVMRSAFHPNAVRSRVDGVPGSRPGQTSISALP